MPENGNLSQPDVPPSSATLLDRYVLETPLATGGMGSVWSGRDLRLGGPVAIKFLIRPGDLHEARFMEEARLASRLTSPNIVRVFDLGVHGTSPFLVMEYLKGETLQERLLGMGRIPPGMTLKILSEVASGLGVAHEEGIVHRDLKPANIFLARAGSSAVAKILDFGVAKSDRALGTSTGEVVGTPYYLSPEQADDSSSVDRRSDLWSLGVIAYECLTGQRPFAASNIARVLDLIEKNKPAKASSIAEVPPGFDEWFSQATASKPGDRFQSAEEFASTLREVLAPDSVDEDFRLSDYNLDRTVGPQTFTRRTARAKKRNRTLAILGLGAIALAGGAIAFYSSSISQPEVSEEEPLDAQKEAASMNLPLAPALPAEEKASGKAEPIPVETETAPAAPSRESVEASPPPTAPPKAQSQSPTPRPAVKKPTTVSRQPTKAQTQRTPSPPTTNKEPKTETEDLWDVRK